MHVLAHEQETATEIIELNLFLLPHKIYSQSIMMENRFTKQCRKLF